LRIELRQTNHDRAVALFGVRSRELRAGSSANGNEVSNHMKIKTAVSLSSFLAFAVLLGLTLAGASASAQNSYTWQEIKDKFEATNPALKADANNVQEMKAEEVTAYLRPNPGFTLSTDGTQVAPYQGIWKPTTGTQVSPNFSYLHERQNKRELRLESAREGTQIATSLHFDLERNLIFNLRSAFVQTLQAKAVVDQSKQELDYYDHIIAISRSRFQAGDLAEIDLARIELQRVQYESDLQTAVVNLRTAKIQLLQLLNDRTPVEQFDVQGSFDFSDKLQPLEAFRQIALDNRPDLKAALQSVQQATSNHKLAIANGSTDPTFGGWYTYNPSFNNPYAHQTVGASVSIPLRIFDRNQGEKQRTQIDVERNQHLEDVTRAQLFSDVDSAYAVLNSNLILLQPYKAKYLAQAVHVREIVTFSYQQGGASLMDFLNAQSDYRNVQLAYLQLIGAYLTAAAQLNLAVGREVLQ
jgi:outer membrane protein, heavy metal efflux system